MLHCDINVQHILVKLLRYSLSHVVCYDANELPNSLLVAGRTLQAQDKVVAAAEVNCDELIRLLRHADPSHLYRHRQVS